MTACDKSRLHRLVEPAERAFLEGSFRRALSLANQCLNQHYQNYCCHEDSSAPAHSLNHETTTTSSSPFDAVVIPLQTIVYFPKQNQTTGGGKASVVEQVPFQLRVQLLSAPTHSVEDASPFSSSSSSRPSSSSSSARHETVTQTPNHPQLMLLLLLQQQQQQQQQHVSQNVDRAAAIALQSWYELFSQAAYDGCSTTSSSDYTPPLPPWRPTFPTTTTTTTTTTSFTLELLAQGFEYLQPFHQVYSLSSLSSSSATAAAASLELTVVFMFFCHAVGFTSEAVELALELVHHILAVSLPSSSSFIPHWEDETRDERKDNDDDDNHSQPKKHEETILMPQRCLHELLEFLLVQQLPYFTSTKVVIDCLRCLQESEYKSPSFDSKRTRQLFWPAGPIHASSSSTVMNLDAVHNIMQFLAHPPVHWPQEVCQTVLVNVRRKLEQQLHLFLSWQQQKKKKIQSGTVVRATSSCPPSSTILSATCPAPVVASRSILDDRKSWWNITMSYSRRWKLVMEHLCAQTLSRLSKSNTNLFDSPNGQHGANTKTAIIAVASLWLLWKHRRQLFEVIYNHLQLLVGLIRQPIQEILEAVL